MNIRPPLRPVFTVAAGPRVGFGHLMRARALARALDARSVAVVRGGSIAARVAASSGFDVVGNLDRALAHANVLVVDDPSPRHARRALAAGRRRQIATVAIHDLGVGVSNADLVVDASIGRRAGSRKRLLHDRPRVQRSFGKRLGLPTCVSGPSFFILDPAFRQRAPRVARHGASRVLIALGGGIHGAHLAGRLVDAIHSAVPGTRVRVAAGFCAGRTRATGRGSWVTCRNGLDRELSRCDVAVVGGGVTLYEACARGRAVVAVPVVAGQWPTVRAARAAGIALVGGGAGRSPAEVATEVAALINNPSRRRELGRTARRVVDGGGALRVAKRIRQLVRNS
jgi:spore coat polysaccharide biosynthesis predicted glycosyltransferase SpsG